MKSFLNYFKLNSANILREIKTIYFNDFHLIVYARLERDSIEEKNKKKCFVSESIGDE